MPPSCRVPPTAHLTRRCTGTSSTEATVTGWHEAGVPSRQPRIRERFTGRIAGVGSTSGVRVVVGRWDDGPWGSFADLMVEDAEGHRVLVAPDEQTRDFVS